MTHTNKRRRSKAHGPANTLRWLLAGAAGAVLLIIAAVALASRQDRSGTTGQKAFDPNFEPAVRGAPRVEVLPQQVIDYGDVKLGTTITTTYQVRNVGDRQLVILGEPQVEVVQGCCPPRAVVSSTTIDPGHEATVALTFMMHAGMGGQHEFRVHLRTNDPAEPDKQLTILSNWVP